MSVQTISWALGRIALTPDTDSARVALFTVPKLRDRVSVVFDCTVETQRAIAAGDPRYIGSFSQADKLEDVMVAINMAMSG